MKKNIIAIIGVVAVIALLAGSATLQATSIYPNALGAAILRTPTAGSSLVLQGAVFGPNGTIIATTAQSSDPLSPMSATAGPAGGAGSTVCTPTTSTGPPVGDGFGVGITVTAPNYNGTATAMSITGSYTITVNGNPTGITRQFSYDQVIPSGQKVTIKALSEDITGPQIVSAVGDKTGKFTASAAPSITMTITYANGKSIVLSATGSAASQVTVSQTSTTTYCASALSVTATGGTFTG